MKTDSRKRLAWILYSTFVLAVFMSTGPGVLLVNRPTLFLGVPMIYAWAVFWYLVQSAVVILAYLFVWRGADTSRDPAT
ncbi:MAG: hypothetical protein QM501_15360 [Gimesia sp.]